ncbi:flagellar biosynthesis repressor FlbT [Erythrobacter ani]|uniref:Uncharacterized protein n=1 Tax=Erythrobacter ani TaxID=2827235 RepID=A0ABS6SMM3_9SPHN|nr:flagellar biosynthesis repressor FlbT [Erythrobacter ani]MBV7265658.1 hypothetical protein [Erythrobacter ani]
MTRTELPKPKTIELQAGAQAVVNGALVTARSPCILDIGSGACVLAGRALWREYGTESSPHEELYFAVLEAAADPESFAAAQYSLFTLLAQVVTFDRTHASQLECAFCASALIAGQTKDAVASAARLATRHVEMQPRVSSVPGVPPRKRDRPVTHEIRGQP